MYAMAMTKLQAHIALSGKWHVFNSTYKIQTGWADTKDWRLLTDGKVVRYGYIFLSVRNTLAESTVRPTAVRIDHNLARGEAFDATHYMEPSHIQKLWDACNTTTMNTQRRMLDEANANIPRQNAALRKILLDKSREMRVASEP